MRLWQCPECSRLQFPQRARCGYCTAGPLVEAQTEAKATIEEATVVERAFGLAAGERLYLATVRHPSGARLIVRLPEAGVPGSLVRLEEQPDGAVWGWPLPVDAETGVAG